PQLPWLDFVARRQARGASFNAALRGVLSSAACDNLSINPDPRTRACVGYCTESACESEHPLTDRPPASVSRISHEHRRPADRHRLRVVAVEPDHGLKTAPAAPTAPPAAALEDPLLTAPRS